MGFFKKGWLKSADDDELRSKKSEITSGTDWGSGSILDGDFDKEIEGLEKELNSVESEIKRASAKLSNSGFLDKAPKALVDAEREKLNKYVDMRDKILKQIQDLKG